MAKRAAPETFVLHLSQIEAKAVDNEHPNRVPFRGVVSRVDEPSSGPPSGTIFRRMMIPDDVANAIGPSMVGMPVNFVMSADNHVQDKIVGVIEEWSIGGSDGKDWIVEGYLFAKNVPKEVQLIQELSAAGKLGMSIELTQAVWENLFAKVLVLKSAVVTGAAILRKDKAAYRKTDLAAADASEDTVMEELLGKVLAAMVTLQASVTSMNEAIGKLTSSASANQDTIKELLPKVSAALTKVDEMSGQVAAAVKAAPTTSTTTGDVTASEVEMETTMVKLFGTVGAAQMKAKAGEGKTWGDVAASLSPASLIAPVANGGDVHAGSVTPVRKTLGYDAQAFVNANSGKLKAADGKYTLGDVQACLREASMNTTQQMNIIMQLEHAGQL